MARIFDVPTALVTFLDGERQWFKAKKGIALTRTPRSIAFCDHTIRQTGILVVPDASQDTRFANNPLVTDDAHIRFYAGAPLVTTD